ncbi:zinc ribbon domain protein [Ferrovum myxofaciens]|uniref:Zinc ribbon domain protein n=1 Tax=Ferrovum myxofaciens TaxID=416213 RepID=A0A149VX09_9PROT|nr:zinc ribbon domain-containing protein [Ferrovum myxofaciens]KXW57757.1 zinc ribbon domain protein [Ferrovum myxofaciens]
MPLYDYQCCECHNLFEKLVFSSTQVMCPACGSTRINKLVSKPAPKSLTAEILSGARKQAAREGHFSNYSASEKPKK